MIIFACHFGVLWQIWRKKVRIISYCIHNFIVFNGWTLWRTTGTLQIIILSRYNSMCNTQRWELETVVLVLILAVPVLVLVLASCGPQMNRQWVVFKTLPAIFHKRMRTDFIQEGILLFFQAQNTAKGRCHKQVLCNSVFSVFSLDLTIWLPWDPFS